MLKNLMYLSIFTTIVIIAWIVFSVYHNLATSTISEDTNVLTTPIQATFDKEVIQGLKLRKKVDADLSQTIVNSEVSSSTPSGEQIQTATGSSSLGL